MRPSIATGPNAEAARHALTVCGIDRGQPKFSGPGRCPRCGYSTSRSDQIRFQLDCDALEKVATEEDRRMLAAAMSPVPNQGRG